MIHTALASVFELRAFALRQLAVTIAIDAGVRRNNLLFLLLSLDETTEDVTMLRAPELGGL